MSRYHLMMLMSTELGKWGILEIMSMGNARRVERGEEQHLDSSW